MTALQIQLAGETVVLYPERAAYLPSRGTLLVADLHLGRQHSWHAQGMPISEVAAESSLDEALARLDSLIEQAKPVRLLVLGDLLHAPSGLTPEMISRVARWRRESRISFQLVPGNHDRGLHAVIESWDLEVLAPTVIDPPFAYTHDESICGELPHSPGLILFCGHFHPMVTISGPCDGMRLPCFHFSSTRALLPAFSGMFSGATIRPKPGDRVYVIAHEDIRDVTQHTVPRPRTPRNLGRVSDRRPSDLRP